jgi:site-specific recombinase XerD
MTEGPSLRRTVSVFLEALAARYGRRPRTIQTYRSALQRFLEYLTDIDLDPEHQTPEALDPAHVRDFIPYLEDRYRREGRTLPSATRQTYLAALVSWVHFLLDEGLWTLPAEEARRLIRELHAQRGRSTPPLPRLPREELLKALLQAARARPSSPSPRHELRRLRDLALVLVLRSSGIRVGELVALRRGDFDPAQGILWIRHGKGGKERLAFLDEAAVRALQAYLQARDAGVRGKGRDHLPLFARHDKGAGAVVRPPDPRRGPPRPGGSGPGGGAGGTPHAPSVPPLLRHARPGGHRRPGRGAGPPGPRLSHHHPPLRPGLPPTPARRPPPGLRGPRALRGLTPTGSCWTPLEVS